MSEKLSYQQLQPEERLTIASLHLQGSIQVCEPWLAYLGAHRELSAAS